MSDSVKNIRANVYINDKQAGRSLRSMEAEAKKVRNELWRMGENADGYREKVKRFRELRSDINRHKKELYGVESVWSKAANGFNKYFALASAGIAALSGVVLSFMNLFNNALDLSDLRADVQKTTELTTSEMNKLQKKLDEFNTRTPRSELLKLASQAGKMGIRGVEDISKFVEEANKINVALGEDLGDDAILKIGKMADVYETSMLKIGSAINKASDSTKANAGYLTEWMSRLAGTANTLDIAGGDILGYGTTLDELGLKVEMSSTALNGFFIDFTKNTEKFGEAAGFAKGELSKIIGKKGTNEGFLAFLDALQKTNPEAEDFLQKLEDVGITGDRGSQVFLALSQNLDKVRATQKLANDEMIKGTSIIDEYNRKNDNLAGNWEKVKRALFAAFVNSSVVNGLTKIVGLMAEMIEIPVSETLEQERVDLRKVELQLYDTNLKQEDRIKLIEDLQKQYPGYLGNIDAETVSNEELSKSIKEINEQLINKIILQKQDEEIQKSNEAVAKKRMKIFELEDKIREKMIAAAEENGHQINKELDLISNAETVFYKFTNNIGDLFSNAHDLGMLLQDYEMAQKSLWILENNNNTAIEKKKELLNKLGISIEEIDEKIEGSAKKQEEGNESIIKSGARVTDEYKKAYGKAEKQIQDFIDNITLGEIEKANKKYKELLTLADKYKLDRVQLEKLLADELKKIRYENIDKEASEGFEREKSIMEKSMNQLWEFEKNELLNEAEEKKWTKEQLNTELEFLELEHLLRLLAARKELGVDIGNIEMDIFNLKESLRKKDEEADKEALESRLKRLDKWQSRSADAGSFIDALRDIELTRIKEITQFQGESEEDFTKRKEAEEKKRKAIMKKYAMIDALADVAQIGISTSAAIMQAVAQLGPIAGAIAAVTIGAMGVAQSGAALAEAKKIKSLHTGGYTDMGIRGIGLGIPDPNVPGRKIMGVVHDEEYVVAKEELKNPAIAPLVDVIEQTRTQRLGGGSFDDGGYTSNSSGGSNSMEVSIHKDFDKSVAHFAAIVQSLQRHGIPVIADDRFARDLEDKKALNDYIKKKSEL